MAKYREEETGIGTAAHHDRSQQTRPHHYATTTTTAPPRLAIPQPFPPSFTLSPRSSAHKEGTRKGHRATNITKRHGERGQGKGGGKDCGGGGRKIRANGVNIIPLATSTPPRLQGFTGTPAAFYWSSHGDFRQSEPKSGSNGRAADGINGKDRHSFKGREERERGTEST